MLNNSKSNPAYIKQWGIKNMGKVALILLTHITGFTVQATVPDRVGWWKFDTASNLTLAENGFGQNLTLVGSHTFVNGPETGNGATHIGVGSYYQMNHLILPNGSGTNVNEYTLQYDFKISGNNSWHSFFQTNVNNSDDGDFFINPSGNIGVFAVGYSGYSIVKNEWYRLLIAVKNPSLFTVYLDGNILLTGNPQLLDSRFSLDDFLLIFADNDGEDGTIICSELAIWDQSLSKEQAKELGGFGHDIAPFLMTRVPYLQGQGQTTLNICWHDTAQTGTKVLYGIDSTSLTFSSPGASEIVNNPYRWHTVKLTGLQANTRYFYKVASGTDLSQTYSFKTLPDSNYSGKLRFILLSDTHSSDSTAVGNVLRAAKAKITELYDPDIENHVNGIFHSGDITVSGNLPEQYTTQYFRPMASLSSYIPTMVVAGNHEGESPYFYQYLKLNDQSIFPNNNGLNEKIWNLKIGNTLFIGLNTNIIEQYGTTQSNWLDTKLNEAENDTAIDFVFLFFHHPPFSELWFDVNTFDGGANYVKNVLFPIIKKYTKVQQINTGHTHGFERGSITSEKQNGNFRIICGGGGGGALDTWGAFTNHDYEDIHIALDNYCFQILEIDLADHSYINTMYSLGNESKPRNSEALDTWYKKTDQNEPETPVAYNVVYNDGFVQFKTSEFAGVDSIMSVRLQVLDSANSSIVVDTMIHWKNIYKVDNAYKPIDKNDGINMYQIKVKSSQFEANNTYLFQVSYRDHNLKWSHWSNAPFFKIIGTKISSDFIEQGYLKQNYPNPFQNTTRIEYYLPAKSNVIFRFLNEQNQVIAFSNEGIKEKGTHSFLFNPVDLDAGIYYYQLISQKTIITKEMVKIN